MKRSFGGKRYRLIDIDNCIADDSWRIPFIDWSTENMEKRYRAYHQLSAFDPPICNREILSPNPDDNIFITARPNFYRPLTMQWLRRRRVEPRALLMRPNDYNGSPSECKRELLMRVRVPLAMIRVAFDDRQDILDMYAEYGILTRRVFIHDVCAMTQPTTERNSQ